MLTQECIDGCQEWLEEIGAELARVEREQRVGKRADLERYGRLAALECQLVAALAVAVVMEAEGQDIGEARR